MFIFSSLYWFDLIVAYLFGSSTFVRGRGAASALSLPMRGWKCSCEGVSWISPEK